MAHNSRAPSSSIYLGKRIALTSKHRKLKLVKPAFDQHVGCEMFEVELDTDQLGTFTGEIERPEPPLQTAILKARLGMRETSASVGMASEGSVGPDPVIPLIRSNVECLVLVDDEQDIIISEFYRSLDIAVATITTSSGADISEFLRKSDFPNHGLIVRPKNEKPIHCIKGITDLQQLFESIEISATHSPDGLVIIESDLRAHHSPSRQKNIEHLAQLLAIRVSQCCPACNSPGWGRISYKKGLKCSDCGLENFNAVRQELLGCVKCDFVKSGKVIANKLGPANCEFCNP